MLSLWQGESARSRRCLQRCELPLFLPLVGVGCLEEVPDPWHPEGCLEEVPGLWHPEGCRREVWGAGWEGAADSTVRRGGGGSRWAAGRPPQG